VSGPLDGRAEHASGARPAVPDADRLVRIAGGAIELEVYPAVGARLHRLRAFGHDLLRTPWDLQPYVDDPYFYGSYPMAPWCNRVAAGRAVVAGRAIDLPATFPDGTAIHGQVSRRAWEDLGDGRFRIEGGGDGWPWRYEVEQAIAIDGDRLELTLRLTNRSDDAMPGGLGFHPWFRAPVHVAIAAAAVHPSNLATEALPVPVSGAYDRRHLEAMPEGLDSTWTDLGDPPVILRWPETGIRATMTIAAPARFVVAANLAGTDAVAVEPQTHAPDGIRRLLAGEPGGLALIPPGARLELAVGLAFERTAPDGGPSGQS
jgi:aldose 1-epimerase